MARTATETARKLIEIYEDNNQRYRLSDVALKEIAGKDRLRDAYLGDVDDGLREEGYVIIDLRREHGCVAVVRQSVQMKYDDLSAQAQDHRFQEEESDEE